MTPEELARQQQQRDRESKGMMGKAMQGARPAPKDSGGWRSNEPAQTPERPSMPTPMPGATGADAGQRDYEPDPERGNRPSRSYGVNEGDQSMADPNMGGDTFGNMMMASKAGPLIEAVRASRAARALSAGDSAANQEVAPTFGQAIARGASGGVPPSMNPQRDQAQADQAAAQQQAMMQQMVFTVDTRTGHFTPHMPGEPVPKPGPGEIQLQLGQDPSTPNILAKGQGVDDQAIAHLQDPQSGIQPTLHPRFQVPPGMEGLAAKLGHDPTRKALIAHIAAKKKAARGVA